MRVKLDMTKRFSVHLRSLRLRMYSGSLSFIDYLSLATNRIDPSPSFPIYFFFKKVIFGSRCHCPVSMSEPESCDSHYYKSRDVNRFSYTTSKVSAIKTCTKFLILRCCASIAHRQGCQGKAKLEFRRVDSYLNEKILLKPFIAFSPVLATLGPLLYATDFMLTFMGLARHHHMSSIC